MRVDVPVGKRIADSPEVVALRGAVIRVENVEEVAIAVVEHAALNLAEADVIPIRVRIAGALAVSRCELGLRPMCWLCTPPLFACRRWPAAAL